jgi:hypothetical protein
VLCGGTKMVVSVLGTSAKVVALVVLTLVLVMTRLKKAAPLVKDSTAACEEAAAAASAMAVKTARVMRMKQDDFMRVS